MKEHIDSTLCHNNYTLIANYQARQSKSDRDYQGESYWEQGFVFACEEENLAGLVRSVDTHRCQRTSKWLALKYHRTEEKERRVPEPPILIYIGRERWCLRGRAASMKEKKWKGRTVEAWKENGRGTERALRSVKYVLRSDPENVKMGCWMVS